MKYFIHPIPIAVEIPAADGTKMRRLIAFVDFIEETVGCDPKSSGSVKALRSTIAALGAISTTVPGQVVAIEDAHYALVASILEEPSAPYHAVIARKCMPFFDAVLGASNSKPEPTIAEKSATLLPLRMTEDRTLAQRIADGDASTATEPS